MSGRAIVGTRELKTRLGTYLRKVRQGRTIVVTDRGEPIAEIRPLDAGSKSGDVALAKLKARGVVTQQEQRPLGPFRAIANRGRPASDAVVEDREDRF